MLAGITTGATSSIWPEKNVKAEEEKYLVSARGRAIRYFGPKGTLKDKYKVSSDPFKDLKELAAILD